ncbi:hypothetical protein ABE504_25135 [Paenibacillus oryzisoli]|uniref:hypothetical protein n=1 Tax=Paenibacillus oryzisoli TaxID=1850517 RepID=UPI003D26D570
MTYGSRKSCWLHRSYKGLAHLIATGDRWAALPCQRRGCGNAHCGRRDRGRPMTEPENGTLSNLDGTLVENHGDDTKAWTAWGFLLVQTTSVLLRAVLRITPAPRAVLDAGYTSRT